jgi:hypothetical protein
MKDHFSGVCDQTEQEAADRTGGRLLLSLTSPRIASASFGQPLTAELSPRVRVAVRAFQNASGAESKAKTMLTATVVE